MLKQKVDAYGNHFDGRLHLWTAGEASRSGTDWLAELYGTDCMSPEDIQALNDMDSDDPGEIPYVSDFSRIVCFGEEDASRDPFCFDFRENLQEPSVIHYDGWYWRRLAPNFDDFIDLYAPSRHVISDAEAQEMYGARPEWPRVQELMEQRGFSSEALAITEEALAKIRAGRGPKISPQAAPSPDNAREAS